MERISKLWLTIAVFYMVAFTASSLWAAGSLDFVGLDSEPRVIGAAIGLAPDYDGSDDYMIGAAPFGKYKWAGRQEYILLRAFELQANIINHPWLRLGPSLNYRFGRKDVDDHYVDKMKDIDGTVEGGGWFGVQFIDASNPRKRFSADVDVLADMTGEHDGYTVYLGARGWYPVYEMIDAYFGMTGCYASSNYMDTYFSVGKTDHERSGLPEFGATSGVKDFRINTAMVMHLSPNWHLAAGVQYRSLLNDAKDSPIVDDRGSANQLIGGLGLAYSW